MDEVREVSFQEFSKSNRFIERLKSRRASFNGTLELTYRCNLDCVHCNVNLPAGDTQAKAEELSYEEICRLVDGMVEEGLLYLELTGGEPIVRRDFKEIYLYIKKKGVLIKLCSNATMITQETADFLAKWPPFMVIITIYGATRETYEKVTGIPGSYERFMKGLRFLSERRIRMAFRTVALTFNQHEVAEMKALASSFGGSFIYYTYVMPRKVRGSKDPLKVRISPQEAARIHLQFEQADRPASQGSCSGCTGRSGTLYASCSAGTTTFNVSPAGRLTACTVSIKRPYDLRRGTFREGWHDFLPKVLAIKKRPSICDTCNIQSICYSCTGVRELEFGISDGALPFFCEMAHHRAELLGLKANTPVIRDPEGGILRHEEEDKKSAERETVQVSETHTHQD